MNHEILQGDVRDVLKTLPDESVDCIITSPPYYGLRDYGTATWEGGDPECDHTTPRSRGDEFRPNEKQAKNAGSRPNKNHACKCGAVRVDLQIGLEETPDAFTSCLVAVFREARRVLKKDGTLWLNIGDSYAGSWGNFGGQNRGEGSQREIVRGSKAVRKFDRSTDSANWRPPTAGKLGSGIKSKDLIGIPWRVALALQQDGWWLRQDIIWHKPNPMPESTEDRCTKAHEYVFLLSKSATYHFDHKAIQEPSTGRDAEQGVPFGWGRGDEPRHAIDLQREGVHRKGRAKTEEREKRAPSNGMRNKRSVWTIAVAPYKGAHYATFPEKLVEPMILAAAPKGGVVLDPFCGSGTVGVVAKRFGRGFIGIELNPDNVAMSQGRIARVTPPLF